MENTSSMLLAKGTLELKLLDQFGNVIEHRVEKNKVVKLGLDYITARMAGTSGLGANVMSHMALGTNSGTAIVIGNSYTNLTSGNQTAFGAANNNIGTTWTATSAGTLGSGTVSLAPNINDSTLYSEIAGTRASNPLTSTTIVTTSTANDTIQYVGTFNAGVGTGAVTEAGVFNAAAAGTMLCRTAFLVINKDVNDTLVITWKVSLAST